ncbi:hypothetical protein JTE90_017787 [Oedothorax gibbosus]|uniref:Uncharacterized protein n=1 Tax=Oedothorax gibbosus TaxID=931172 RepID=A0AAV6TJ02_9ARAC|nr:hypothetical protein JTE90_017787 [Oedothorax gibbosus]
MHCFLVENEKPIGYMLTSSTIQEAEATIQDDEDDYKAGEWVLVQYEGKYYPGEVVGNEGDSYCVNVMIPAGKNWRWPQNPDQILYEKENIVKKLGLPRISERICLGGNYFEETADELVTDKLDWLSKSGVSYEKAYLYWKETVEVRNKQFQGHNLEIYQYFDKYPLLKKNTGSKLMKT